MEVVLIRSRVRICYSNSREDGVVLETYAILKQTN